MIPSSTSQQASEPRFSSQRETAGHHAGWVFGTHRFERVAMLVVIGDLLWGINNAVKLLTVD